ncbi:MAG: cell wall hydrolase [Roseburia sp.]|nr:cell wall hydrolase [Roseburia sp.]MCM1099187.1 cell wall hydrolase [Ruminococcus flavefaciens]
MRRFRKKTAVVIAVIALIVAFRDIGEVKTPPGVIVASATSSTQQQINEAEERRRELEEERKRNESQLEGLKGEQKDLKRELNKLNEQLSQVRANLEDLERQIAEKEQEILDAQAALEEARATEAWQYECMVARTRDMYERKEDSYLSALLKENSLAGLLNAADYIERIAAYDRRKMNEFMENRAYIEQEEARLQREKTELDNLKVEVEAERSKIAGLISKTSGSIAQYGDQIADAEQRAREYEDKIKAEEENLEVLRKKLAEEMALSRAAANGTWRNISDIVFTENDRYLLANLIYCEAGAEPYEGKVAVGSVVINRVLSSKFPNTVLGVIYQSRQFSPVASGRLELALATGKATQSCYQAADEAMSGVTNVGTCVFFRTPIEGLTGINIGGHVFY